MSLRPELWGRRWVKWVARIVAVLVAAVSVVAATTRMYRVAGSSMMPTLVVGDRVIVNLMAYDLKVPFTTRRILRLCNPKAGDIVLFSVPNAWYVGFKRVVAIPGDRVELRDNHLFINGQMATYEPLDPAAFDQLPADALRGRRLLMEKIGDLSTAILLTDTSVPQGSFGPMAVQQNHYFVLGDFRDNSNDSRIFGPLGREQIEGRLDVKVF